MSTQICIDEQLIKYLEKTGYRPNDIIDQLVSETLALGNVSRMQIAPEQGQFLEIIVKISGAKNCLEIGRFTGLSTLCMARGLPKNGKIITIDNSDEFLNLAKRFWIKADVQKKIKSIIGEGLNVLKDLIDVKKNFDIIFIDADKKNYDNYFEMSLKLISSNGLIMIDNMLWGGDVADLKKTDESTKSIRFLNKKLFKDPRVECSLLPLADGLLMIRKK